MPGPSIRPVLPLGWLVVGGVLSGLLRGGLPCKEVVRLGVPTVHNAGAPAPGRDIGCGGRRPVGSQPLPPRRLSERWRRLPFHRVAGPFRSTGGNAVLICLRTQLRIGCVSVIRLTYGTSESVVRTFWKLSGQLEQGEGTSGLVA